MTYCSGNVLLLSLYRLALVLSYGVWVAAGLAQIVSLAIGELNFPEAQELLAKFYDLQAQIDRLSQGGSSD